MLYDVSENKVWCRTNGAEDDVVINIFYKTYFHILNSYLNILCNFFVQTFYEWVCMIVCVAIMDWCIFFTCYLKSKNVTFSSCLRKMHQSIMTTFCLESVTVSRFTDLHRSKVLQWRSVLPLSHRLSLQPGRGWGGSSPPRSVPTRGNPWGSRCPPRSRCWGRSSGPGLRGHKTYTMERKKKNLKYFLSSF